MVETAEGENDGGAGTTTPPLPGPSSPPHEKTIKLDRAIVENAVTLPSRFGRYEVIQRIGVGGFASVFSARDPDLDALVAIKVLAENHSADIEVRKRFVAEARVARRLGGDRLIGVFDLGETDDGRPFVVMELAAGGTLRARLNRLGRPSPGSLIRLIEELGACMEAVHSNNVIHRDIKPSNLLLRSTDNGPTRRPADLIDDHERLVLADFGLARDISGGASAVTVGGGTAGYMAPEQADPEGKADERADLYAATVVMAELTTGRHPERLDLATANVSEAVREALLRGMSIDREQRPGTAMAWRDELLAAYLQPTASPASPTRPDDTGGTIDTVDVTRALDPRSVAAPHDHTVAIDATKVRAPHQFRDAAAQDGEYDESEIYLRSDDPGTSPMPHTFVRPVVDDEPPPPPPSIRLSSKVQRPAPGPGTDGPRHAPGRSPRPGASPPVALVEQPPPPSVPPPPAGPAPPPSRAEIKQRQRVIRRAERQRRRRRRRRRYWNIVLALVRGALAWMVASLVVSAALSVYLEIPLDQVAQRERAQSVVNLAGIAGFILGLRLFPWPRRLDPNG